MNARDEAIAALAEEKGFPRDENNQIPATVLRDFDFVIKVLTEIVAANPQYPIQVWSATTEIIILGKKMAGYKSQASSFTSLTAEIAHAWKDVTSTPGTFVVETSKPFISDATGRHIYE